MWISRWAYARGGGPLWWLWCLPLAVLAAVLGYLPRPWSWLIAAPVVVMAILIFDGHARWQRDEQRRRVEASRRDT